MIKRIKLFFKYLKLRKKIQNKLPNFDPYTGDHFVWNIEIGHYRDIGYNTKTGIALKSVLVPKVKILQVPIGVCTGQKCHRYCVARKQVEIIPHARFG